MKRYILCLFTLILFVDVYSQDDKNKKKDDGTIGDQNPSNDKVASKPEDKTNIGVDIGSYGWQDRFAIFLGAGVGVTAGQLYNDPVINPTNNIVEIESSQKITTSLSLGLVFTPHVYNVTRTIPVTDKDGKKSDVNLIAYVPKGISYALFLSPVSLTKLNNSGFVNNIDVGFGMGYRDGDFLFLVAVDFISIRQPRQYFVDQFKNNNLTYNVGGQTQSTIDVTNNNIFYNKLETVIGIKVCYAFSLAKSFYSSAQQIGK